jgi:NAD(P)H-hydrate repair Nnr-like enzyme with NAD(P)H-hydrate dehydratase domain
LGVYLHGLCGELAASSRHTSRGVMATDLINQLGTAYHLLHNSSLS